jgi:membrane-bound lytic murein transglycosylase B
LDRHQPEFTLTWAQYRSRVISPAREQGALESYRRNLPLLTEIWRRFHVDPRVVIGIWGLESNFGTRIGSFNVVDALATLAYDGRRASFFRGELMNALRILGSGNIAPSSMLGSYAGAMGQPQFMPSSYLRYAVNYNGDGHGNIWTDRADVFASIANYLAKCGWVNGEPWGQPVTLTRAIAASAVGRQMVRPLEVWDQAGVRRRDGARFSQFNAKGALLLPDGPSGEAFMVYSNFNVIRRYNPSDFYALAVGLIGNAAA